VGSVGGMKPVTIIEMETRQVALRRLLVFVLAAHSLCFEFTCKSINNVKRRSSSAGSFLGFHETARNCDMVEIVVVFIFFGP
jgi:hypothetical protein